MSSIIFSYSKRHFRSVLSSVSSSLRPDGCGVKVVELVFEGISEQARD
jgi:hypothetical protein